MCLWHHSVGPPRSHRNQRQFRSSQPSGAARPHSDLRMTPLRWTTQGPTNVRQFRSSRPPGTARPPSGRLASQEHESGDNFAIRSPEGRRGFIRSSRPPGTARPHSDLRVAAFCWASQEPPKPATVSQLAAPRDGEVSSWSAYDTNPLDLPGAHERCGSFAVRSPQGRRSLILVCI